MFKVTSFAVIAVLAVAAHAQSLPPNCARTYTVQAGDTCNSISADQGVSTFQLANVNQGVINASCNNLQAGQTICLGITGQDCTTIEVVQSGDTCDSIAQDAGISTSLLLQNNPNINQGCTNIGVGDVLCTASTPVVGGGSSSGTSAPLTPVTLNSTTA